MNFSFLKKIVNECAIQLQEDAGHSGSHTDGGCASLLLRLKDYQNKYIIQLDLRPSELHKLDEIEIGEPI